MVTKPIKYRTIADLCRALGWGRASVDHRIWKSQVIPPPTHTRGLGRRRYYTSEEIEQIVEMVKEEDSGEGQ
jgi:hypothetical protein